VAEGEGEEDQNEEDDDEQEEEGDDEVQAEEVPVVPTIMIPMKRRASTGRRPPRTPARGGSVKVAPTPNRNVTAKVDSNIRGRGRGARAGSPRGRGMSRTAQR